MLAGAKRKKPRVGKGKGEGLPGRGQSTSKGLRAGPLLEDPGEQLVRVAGMERATDAGWESLP